MKIISAPAFAAALLLAAWQPRLRAQGETLPAPSASPAATPVTIFSTPSPRDIAHVNHIRALMRDVESNTDNIKSKGDFGAQLWLVAGQDFFLDWRKPQAPAIDPIELVQRGEEINTAFIFYGPAHDTADLSSVTYDVTVLRPDGKVSSERKNLIGWQDLTPGSPRLLELGRDRLSIVIGPSDPAGLYTVQATVRDNVSHVELPLKQTFVVQ
jgi:hypothetical protein